MKRAMPPGLSDASVPPHDTAVAETMDSEAAARELPQIELPTVDANCYESRTLLAEGGMGRVVIARDRRLGRKVAIKELRVDTSATRARFEREAMLTARLEHPGIVGVHEAGRWPSGEPFFAMRIVRGKPFDRVLAGLSTLATRIAHVPTVLAVADAIAYAHDQGVIHRDLKPHNVMVGEFGETVVIDWGLAKDIDDIEPSSLPDLTAKGDLTIAGSVVGTPMYLSPEQARGIEVGRTADVYSLGAVLYELLAGTTPYRGPTAEAILADVVAGPPPALPADVPAELVAIVERAMARVPEDRYPSARELAEDLRRFQAGQLVGAHRYTTRQLLRRWMRRNRTILVTTSLALVVIGVIGVIAVVRLIDERAEANRQRDLAIAQHEKAEDLAKFMQKDVRDQLATLNRMDLLEPIARKAIDYRTSQQSSPVATANAYRDLSDALVAKGDSKGSLEALDRALEASAGALPTYESRRDRSILFNRRGDSLSARSEWKLALEAYRNALEIANQLLREDPNNARTRLDIAFGEVKVAEALSNSGDMRGALDAARRALAVLEEVKPTTNDERKSVERQRASIALEIGEHTARLGDSAGAIRELERAVTLAEAVAKNDRGWRSQRMVSIALQRVAGVRETSGDLGGAQRDYERADRWIADLYAIDRNNAIVARDRQIVKNSLGDLAKERNDRAAARVHYAEAVGVAELASGRDPSNQQAIGDLATALGRLASVSDKDALELVQRSLTLRLRVLERAPHNARFKRDVLVGHHQLFQVHIERKDLAAARRSAEAALAIAKELVVADPNDVRAQRNLSSSHVALANVLGDLGDHRGALTELRADFAIAAALAKRDPANLKWQRDLALSHAKLGSVLVKVGDKAAARTEYQAALAIIERAGPKGDMKKLGDDVRDRLRRCCP